MEPYFKPGDFIAVDLHLVCRRVCSVFLKGRLPWAAIGGIWG